MGALPSRADQVLEEMGCLFQKLPRAMATGQHVTKDTQSYLRSLDICSNRINATRKCVQGSDGAGKLVQRAETSDAAQQVGCGDSWLTSLSS